jgi:hypothetical protein
MHKKEKKTESSSDDSKGKEQSVKPALYPEMPFMYPFPPTPMAMPYMNHPQGMMHPATQPNPVDFHRMMMQQYAKYMRIIILGSRIRMNISTCLFRSQKRIMISL